MRITVCELPHDPDALARAWPALCEHTARERTELLVLPEFAFAPPVWLSEHFDPAVWAAAEAACERAAQRFCELGVAHVVGARPVTRGGQPYNEGFLWSARQGLQALRRKFHLPEEPGGWEARWFTRGDRDFPAFRAGDLAFGLSICTELWALENCAGYAQAGVGAILSPRATAATTTGKWLALGQVVAARSGAFSISSNRVDADGPCGGAGWIIDPDGALLAQTSAEFPFRTLDVDLRQAAAARATYPRYVFQGRPPRDADGGFDAGR
jgi:N-carbamoylputrescine amidase